MVRLSWKSLLVGLLSVAQRPEGFQKAEAFQPSMLRLRSYADATTSWTPGESLSVHARSLCPRQFMVADAAESTSTIQSFVHNRDFWVFVAGIFPFAWATVEFWRRIAFGESFGTGRDSIVIGMDDSPADSRGRRVLGKGALATAVFLFTVAFGTLAIVLFSVLTSDAPPEFLPSLSSTVDGFPAP